MATAAEKANALHQEQVRIGNYNNSNNKGQISQLGMTTAEKASQQAGLDLAKTGYGQNLGTTGDDIQRIKELQRQRTGQSGGDPVSAAIMGQQASATANTQRNLAASGVKGGTAAGAIDNISKQQNAEIAASLYGQQRQSIADERSLASNMLGGTTALANGEKAVGTTKDMPDAPDTGGMCCFIFLEARYGNGVMDSVVRRYRDENMTDINRRGYYKVSEVLVPLMRKYPLIKFITRLTLTDPLVAYAKAYYGTGSMAGKIFKPVVNFWVGIFEYLGKDCVFVRENGEVI